MDANTITIATSYYQSMALKFSEMFRRKVPQAAEPTPSAELESLRAMAAGALQGGELERAVELYEGLIGRKPDDAEAHYKRANALNMLGRFEAAVAGYDRAVALKPDYANAYCNRGTVLERLGRWEEALASYERTLELNPADALTYYNRGSVLKELKRLEEALASYDRAIGLRSDYVEAHFNRGNVLQALRQYQAAVGSYERVLELKPAFAEAFHARGLSLTNLRRLPEALASYDRAIALDVNFTEAYVNRGHLLHDLQRYDAAVRDYSRAIELDANRSEIWLGLGSSLSRLKRHEEAIRSFDRALAVKPDQKYLIGLRQYAKMQICDWSELAPELQRLKIGLESSQAVSVPLTVLALFDSPPLHECVSRVWVREECPPDDSLGVIANRPRSDRIRVGYFSADFRTHPVSLLTAGLFEQHDRSKFEITAFAFGSDADDPVRARLRRAFDHFIDINARSDSEVALLARELGIDIAVDLGGFTEHARTKIFAQRAAPLQVSYLGYAGTSGAPYIDYLIADRTLIPEGAERHYSEQIIRLPDSFMATDSTRSVADRIFTREELGLPNERFVFCCFNRGFKLMPDTFDDWMTILKAVEGSVLWLSEGDKSAVANLRQEAARRHVSPERLIFATPMPSMAEHLARQRAADLFLDTLPFNAHTTANDALWAGLPVLTCAGHALPGRVAASLLNALDLPELITTARQHYRELAVRLALNPAELRQIREKLARNRLTAPLFDTVRFTRNLESAFTSIYERQQSGLPPAHILVDRKA
jgi:predicted O-linked N-acetylglucosamine transferase (SPINDLY family)